MSRIFFKKEGQKPSIFVTLGLVCTGLTFVALVVAGPLVRLGLFGTPETAPGLFDLQFKMILTASRLLLVSALFTLVGVVHGRMSSRARTSWRAFVAALLIAAMGWPLWQVHSAYRDAPVLHDISTQPQQLMQFESLSERTYDATSSAGVAGSRLDQTYLHKHMAAYPDMIAERFDQPPAQAFDRVLVAARGLGWRIVRTDPQAGDIEALCRSPWFGFTSFIKMEVRAYGAGAALDIRVVSEMGHTDMGIGAGLIRRLKKALARPGTDRG
jgi:hypothetical protein